MGLPPPKSIDELLSRYAAGERSFVGAELDQSPGNLEDAMLDGVDLSESWFSTSFRRASLRGACFHRANVKCCDFSGADLTGADFTESALESTEWSGAIVDGARFGGAGIHSYTMSDDWLPDTDDLRRAAYDADLKATHALLEAGAAVDARDGQGFTPLLWACFRGAVGDQRPVVEALLAAGADPNAVAYSGVHACLHDAAHSGVVAIVEALIAAGATVDALADGVTALMVAAGDGDDEMVACLLGLGADPTVKCGRFTAADYARYYGYHDLAERLEAVRSAAHP